MVIRHVPCHSFPLSLTQVKAVQQQQKLSAAAAAVASRGLSPTASGIFVTGKNSATPTSPSSSSDAPSRFQLLQSPPKSKVSPAAHSASGSPESTPVEASHSAPGGPPAPPAQSMSAGQQQLSTTVTLRLVWCQPLCQRNRNGLSRHPVMRECIVGSWPSWSQSQQRGGG